MDKKIFTTLFLSKENYDVLFFGGFPYDFSSIDNLNNVISIRGKSTSLLEIHNKIAKLKNVNINFI